MKISRREGILIAACLVVVAVIGVPSLKQLTGVVGGKSAQDLAAEKKRADQACARLRGEIELASREVERLTWKEPADRLAPLLLLELHDAARRAGVSVGGFRPAKALPAAGGSKLPVTVEITAPFPRAVAFLAEVSRRSDRVALERLQVASSDASSDKVAMQMRLVVYSAEAPAAAAAKRAGTKAGGAPDKL